MPGGGFVQGLTVSPVNPSRLVKVRHFTQERPLALQPAALSVSIRDRSGEPDRRQFSLVPRSGNPLHTDVLASVSHSFFLSKCIQVQDVELMSACEHVPEGPAGL